MLGISKALLYQYDKRGEITHETWLPNGRRKYRGREIVRFHGNTDARASRKIKFNPQIAVRVNEGKGVAGFKSSKAV